MFFIFLGNLTQARVIREERMSLEELPPTACEHVCEAFFGILTDVEAPQFTVASAMPEQAVLYCI